MNRLSAVVERCVRAHLCNGVSAGVAFPSARPRPADIGGGEYARTIRRLHIGPGVCRPGLPVGARSRRFLAPTGAV
jgi:hypothetical protein